MPKPEKTPAKDKPTNPDAKPDVGAMTGPELAEWLYGWCVWMSLSADEVSKLTRIIDYLRGTKGRRKCCDSKRGKDVPHAAECPQYLADGTFRPVAEKAAE